MAVVATQRGRRVERLGGEDTGMPTSNRNVAVASFIGTTIEWYDYFIYGTAAALVFPALFFPDIYEEEPQERQLITEQG